MNRVQVRRPKLAVALAAAIVMAGAGMAAAVLTNGSTTGPQAGLITGNFDVVQTGAFAPGEPCAGTGENALIHDGTPVTVEGPDGVELGRSTLTNGRGFETTGDKVVAMSGPSIGASVCRFHYAVNVPAAKRYTIAVTVHEDIVYNDSLVEDSWRHDMVTDLNG